MGYKKQLKYRVIDMLQFKHRNNNVRPSFLLIDCIRDKHFGIIILKRDVGYFIRHAGEYGLTYEKAMCEKIGTEVPIGLEAFDVHIVESKDETKQTKNKE